MLFFRPACIAAVKTPENSFFFRVRNAGTVIDDRQLHKVRFTASANLDGGSLRCIRAGVGKQNTKQLGQAFPVQRKMRQRLVGQFQCQHMALIMAYRMEPLVQIDTESVQLHIGTANMPRAGIASRQRQEVVNETGHAAGFLLRRIQKGFAFGTVCPAGSGKTSLDDRQRAAQFMAGSCNEFCLAAKCLHCGLQCHSGEKPADSDQTGHSQQRNQAINCTGFHQVHALRRIGLQHDQTKRLRASQIGHGAVIAFFLLALNGEACFGAIHHSGKTACSGFSLGTGSQFVPRGLRVPNSTEVEGDIVVADPDGDVVGGLLLFEPCVGDAVRFAQFFPYSGKGLQKQCFLTFQVLDAAAVANAQQQLNWAYEDQEKARQTLEALQAAHEPDEQAIEQARQAYESAVRASQTAENARNSALEDYEKQKQQNEKNALTNQADAAVLRVDIEEKQTEIHALEQLAETNGQITAPLAGTLTAWKLTEGTTSGTQACTLADAAQGYELEFTLSETDAEHAQLGAQVQIVQKNQTQTAAVTALGAPREDGSLTVTAQLEGGDWKQGAAMGTMTLSRTDYDLCVPASAVHSDNRGTFVYVLEERETVLGTQNVLLRVPVEVLENGRTQTAIFSAILTAFDQVVASSTKPLSKGARVRVDAS